MTAHLTGYAGRTVVVTGGASGIGRALGEAFAAERARVVLSDVEEAALTATVAELVAQGHDVVGVRCDVTDPASVEALAEGVFASHGAVHVLVNNAGVGAPSARPWETTPNDWRWVHSVNVFGVAHGVQAFVPRMLASGEPGHVVNTASSDGAVNPLPDASVYAASKAAVATLTECLAAQLEAEAAPIGVSLFLPGGGVLDTGLWTADRNRPADLARERPRARPGMTVKEFQALMAERGAELQLKPLDELAAELLEGVLKGVYCVADDLGAEVGRLHARADRLAEGRHPTLEAGLGS
ncbi:NADP-dependent 3-hydroxy acid dehydrogenase YdfG [Actinocorallia herbida]|uniref:NADP-dependent 3-hydroxy acid dehydrogenase YdfG n=1 Tax=Actinocorallia herbida TaxID=58109 RepID=A0A3N1CVZ1_9ACTN|nr:SDR family NAD(P)-dependent oxidoreductase [Actinocorallia herbida]ROO85436.1 NADP-dependent 3-hydroxy acid dehydrogenase YdfG [Actinocorallia herbida]